MITHGRQILPGAAGRVPLASLLLFTAAGLAYLFPQASTALQYDRHAVEAGQIWRTLTAHWTHWSFDHLLWDALTFLALGSPCEQRSRGAFLACVLTSALTIHMILFIFLPEMNFYRGLSGIDAALFALLATSLLREKLVRCEWTWLAAIVIGFALLAAKVAYEASTGQTIFVTDLGQADPVPLAHLAGGITGIACGMLFSFPSSTEQENNDS